MQAKPNSEKLDMEHMSIESWLAIAKAPEMVGKLAKPGLPSALPRPPRHHKKLARCMVGLEDLLSDHWFSAWGWKTCQMQITGKKSLMDGRLHFCITKFIIESWWTLASAGSFGHECQWNAPAPEGEIGITWTGMCNCWCTTCYSLLFVLVSVLKGFLIGGDLLPKS